MSGTLKACTELDIGPGSVFGALASEYSFSSSLHAPMPTMPKKYRKLSGRCHRRRDGIVSKSKQCLKWQKEFEHVVIWKPSNASFVPTHQLPPAFARSCAHTDVPSKQIWCRVVLL
eukprot:89998-Pelagomonas_calceolata.AAC.1